MAACCAQHNSIALDDYYIIIDIHMCMYANTAPHMHVCTIFFHQLMKDYVGTLSYGLVVTI